MKQKTADAILEWVENDNRSNVIGRVLFLWSPFKTFVNSLVSNPQWEESEMRRCRCGEPMSYSRTLLMELEEYHWTCMNCGWTQIESNSLVVEDEQKIGCFFCSDPDCHNECIKETDEEISLRMWEEFENEIYSQEGEQHEVPAFPDWLKERHD